MKIISFCLVSKLYKGVLLKGCLNYHIPATVFTYNRNFSHWDLVSAVCLERKPILTQELTSFEKRYWDYLQQVEFENSYLSDHEIQHEEDLRIAQKIKSGDVEDIDSISKQTAQDFEDVNQERYDKFKPASRITEADLQNNQKSVERKLDRSLLLVVKQKLGNDFRWILPQGVHEEGETLRQTAERVLRETCGDKMKVRFMGNAPVGFYKYKYPKVVRGNGICGAKVFFFKAQFQGGEIRLDSVKKHLFVDDFLWLTRPEMKELMQPVYCKAVESFLLPDEVSEESEESEQDIRNKQIVAH